MWTKQQWDNLIEGYCHDKQLNNPEFKSIEGYRSILKKFDLEEFSKFSTKEAQNFFDEMVNNKAINTINQWISIIKSFNDFLEKKTFNELNFVKNLNYLRFEKTNNNQKQQKQLILTESELQQIQKQIRGADWFKLSLFLESGIKLTDYNKLVTNLKNYDKNLGILIPNRNINRRLFITDQTYNEYLKNYQNDKLMMSEEELEDWIIKLNSETNHLLNFQILRDTWYRTYN